MTTLEETREANVDLIDRLFKLSNRCAIGDASAMSELLACYHEDAEMRPALEVVPSDLRAADVIRRYFERVCETCYLWFIYADDVQGHDDRVLVLGGIRTVDRKTRDDAERPVGWIFEVRDGKIGGVHAYPSYRDAMSALRRRD